MARATKTKGASSEQDRRVEYVPLAEIKRAKRNPKDHDLGALAESLKRFGFVAPMLLDERTGRLAAGHGRLELLAKMEAAKEEPPRGVQVNAEGEWLAPVIRGWRSKNDQEVEAYLVADNRIGELGGWHEDKLQELLQELQSGEGLAGTGYDGDDLDTMLANLEGQPAADVDSVPEPVERPWVKEGELYELGAHRLLVGDSHRQEDRARLFGDLTHVDAVVTDPPYAIYGSATGLASDIADDKMVRPFFEAILRMAYDVIPLFAHVYLFCDWRTWPAIWESAKRAALSPKNLIVWDKGGGGLGSNWANAYELVAYMSKIPPRLHMRGQGETGQRLVHKPNIMRHSRPTGDQREHNAAKPVALVRELVEAATDPGQVVLEPFTGGGSTLIACELSGRRCLAMEIEPKFAQVAIERWQRVTGQKARLLEGAPEEA